MFYFWNIKPLSSNIYLIKALKSVQMQEFESAGQYFQKAYGASSTLGRYEVVQHMAANSLPILQNNLSTEKKNAFYAFAKEAVTKEANDFPNDGRMQLLTGEFLVSTGFPDEALVYLERVRTFMPGKQQVYFDIGSAYFAKNDPTTGLALFKNAYDLAPNYDEAKIIYLIGAIYTGSRTLENKLILELPKSIVDGDSRIRAAYSAVGR